MKMTERDFYETLETHYARMRTLETIHDDCVIEIDSLEVTINNLIEEYYAQSFVDELINKNQVRINNE